MPKRKQNPEVCDATGLNSSNAAGYKKNSPAKCCTYLLV